jgi:multidrug efflux pump subunit AcrA (membrane-fusion protein)
LLASCLGLAGCDKRAETSRRSATPKPYLVDVVTVDARPFRETLFATGSLVARETVQLQSERSGIVKAISFDEGKPVKAGDVLLAIDDSELRAQRREPRRNSNSRPPPRRASVISCSRAASVRRTTIKALRTSTSRKPKWR